MKAPRDSGVEWAKGLFFAQSCPEDRWSPVTKYLVILLLFALTRAFVAGVYDLRGIGPLGYNTDSSGFLATADYIRAHGHLSTENNYLYRGFAGLPLLIAALTSVIGNTIVSGYVIVLFSGLAVLFLVQHWFNHLRLTILCTVFFPYWISATSQVLSEGPAVLCLLVGAWSVIYLRDRPALLYPAMLVAGYGMVIRHPAALLIMPTLFLLAWRQPNGSFVRACLLCAVAFVPLAIYLSWNWMTIHELVPQKKLDEINMVEERMSRPNPEHFSTRTFNFPFCALWEGLTDPYQKPVKKLEVLASVLVTIAALIRLAFIFRAAPFTREGTLALAFGTGLFLYLMFHVSVEFTVGFKYLDRFLCYASVIVNWALFDRHPLRWGWLVLLIMGGTLFASMTGEGPVHIGFIK